MRALVPLFFAIAVAACGKSEETAAPATASSSPAAQTGAPVLPADALQQLDRYEVQARELVSAIDEGEPVDELQAHAEELVATAEAVLPAFVALRPHCEDYLDAALALKDSWAAMSAEQIEAGYHKDGAMPKIEDAAACYHMKDLIVHPVTAMALLGESADNAGKAKREIEEVVAHVSVVKATR